MIVVIRPTSNTSPTLRNRFTLKSYKPIYIVLPSTIFCHFFNTNVAEFYESMSFLMSTQFHDGSDIFIETLGDWKTKEGSST